MTEREQHRGQSSDLRPPDVCDSGHGTSLGYRTMRRLLLDALAETPLHGYELIRHLSESVGAGYRPSAGAIYPRLAKLAQEGLVTRHRVGRTFVYTLTDAGRTSLENVSPRPSKSIRAAASPDPNAALEESLDVLETFCRGVAMDLRKHARAGGLSLVMARDLESFLDETRDAITHILASG